MNKTDLQRMLDLLPVYIPVSKIELDIGMPKTTLQKSLKNEQKKLPKKWVKPFLSYIKNKVKDEENIPVHKRATS